MASENQLYHERSKLAVKTNVGLILAPRLGVRLFPELSLARQNQAMVANQLMFVVRNRDSQRFPLSA